MKYQKIDPQKLCGYSEYLWKEGWLEGWLEEYNKALLKAYINMKNANGTDRYICSMLGISRRKLQEIKRLFNETIARETSPLT
jgi:hypothetical protein